MESLMKKMLFCLGGLSLVAAVFLLQQHLSYKDRIYSASKKQFQALTVKSAKEIDALVRQMIDDTESFAADLTAGKIGMNSLKKLEKKIIKKHPYVNGVTVAFKPSDEQGKKLYAPYWTRSSEEGHDGLRFGKIEDVYDYTTPEHEWYFKPMSEKKNVWTEPYWGQATQAYLISYSALFYDRSSSNGEKEPAGVVTVDLALKYIKKIIESQSLGRNGFGGLTTGSGRYLYHPEQEYTVSSKSLQDIAQEKNDADRLKVAEMAKRGQSGIMDHVSTTTGEDSWLMVEPVPTSGWSLQNTFIKNDIAVNTDTLRHQAILIVLSLVVFLTSLIFLVLLCGFPFTGKAWTSVVLFSLIMAAGIGSIWRCALLYEEYKQDEHTVITDEKTLDNIVSRLKWIRQERSSDKDSSIFFIPTGIYIESIEFSSANKMSVSGYVWQKYPDGFPDNMKKFQIVPFVKMKTEQVWTKKMKSMEIVRTRFEADIPVHISYAKYPLEVEEICIQILSVDNSSVAFIPDFDSNMIDATVRFPGLSKDVSLTGWELTRTLFTLDDQQADSNFGIAADFDQEKLPVLSYRIGIKRSFINAFISNLIPLIVVAIILFFVLLFPDGVDIDKVLGISTSLSFVVVFSHVGIRKTIIVDELFYLEYFFFVLYGCVVTTPIKAFLIKYGYKGKLVTYRDGIIIKAAYWPVLLSILFTITAFVFY